MRGAGSASAYGVGDRGITPACAGSSVVASDQVPKLKDHPRLCGEQMLRVKGHVVGTGSPPPVRGAVPLVVPDGLGAGITPACAGSSQPLKITTHVLPDHPRLCGEQRLLS